MELTPDQKTALRTNIDNTPSALTLFTDGNLQGLADFYNAAADPAYVIWRSSIPQDEIMLNGFDWSRVDNLSVGKARIWEWMFDNTLKAIDATKPNIRAGIDATWVGTPADLAVRAAVYVHCKRNASRLEALFSTGSGSDASPSVTAIEGVAPYTIFSGL